VNELSGVVDIEKPARGEEELKALNILRGVGVERTHLGNKARKEGIGVGRLGEPNLGGGGISRAEASRRSEQRYYHWVKGSVPYRPW